MILHIATTNLGKLRDFAAAAAASGFGRSVELTTIPGMAHIVAPEEDCDTFAGNAALKAMYYSQRASGLLVMADDSGLEVDALQGRPGVRSARFARDLGRFDDTGNPDAANNDALLLAMLEQTNRAARYRCALAVARDGAMLAEADGSLEGEILDEPEGEGGFGYDPLFFVPELSCTMAQAAVADRLRLSHRGRALRALLARLPPTV